MKKIMLLFVFVLAGISTVLSQSIPYTDTGSKEGEIVRVEVTGNDTEPIILIKGTHAYFTIVFDALEDIVGGDNIKAEGYLTLKGLPAVPFYYCYFEDAPQIYTKSSRYRILIRVDIDKLIPIADGTLELSLKNEKTGNKIISFKVGVQFKDR